MEEDHDRWRRSQLPQKLAEDDGSRFTGLVKEDTQTSDLTERRASKPLRQ
jgi:hypothetical protein